MTSPDPQSVASSHPLILFDGVCGLCNRSVNFIIDRDPTAHFHFAPLQSPLAARILADHRNAAPDLSTIILIDNGQIYHRSSAALRIARHLSGPVSILALLIVVPRPLRDAVYNGIARNRYRWFGKSEACRLPDAKVAARFLLD